VLRQSRLFMTAHQFHFGVALGFAPVLGVGDGAGFAVACSGFVVDKDLM